MSKTLFDFVVVVDLLLSVTAIAVQLADAHFYRRFSSLSRARLLLLYMYAVTLQKKEEKKPFFFASCRWFDISIRKKTPNIGKKKEK